MSLVVEAKKRTRKKKSDLSVEEIVSISPTPNIQLTVEHTDIPVTPCIDIKKRGRKPKGGKLLPKNQLTSQEAQPIQNVILHLKCSTKDLVENSRFIDPLTYNTEAPPDIMTYSPHENNTAFTMYNSDDDDKKYAYANRKRVSITESSICEQCKNSSLDHSQLDSHENNDERVDNKVINQKLKKIKLDLYKNNLSDKQSSCFWCTYEFDNPPCYIPKYEIDGEMCAYGSFCRPECAVAFLMKENIDDSTKFERYQFVNQVYGKIYDFKHNIKPAPNPYYLLDKFYGNLTIKEYRELLKSDHMLSVIEKPLTRILPELHEDNDDYSSSIYGKSDTYSSQTTSGYKVKRKSNKAIGPSKEDIMRETFGMSRV
jgi:hypothetical protein